MEGEVEGEHGVGASAGVTECVPGVRVGVRVRVRVQVRERVRVREGKV